MTSAALAAIFAKSLVFEPGPNNWQRFGRAGGVGCKRNDMGKSLAKYNYVIVAKADILLRHWQQVEFATAA
jgi:hypothetical protein